MDSRSELSPHQDKLVCAGEGFLFFRSLGGVVLMAKNQPMKNWKEKRLNVGGEKKSW